MAQVLRSSSAPAVRLLALAALAVVWGAVLVWLWTDETSLSCFEYVEYGSAGPSCAELAEREMRRFNIWFLLAVVAGPALGVALWFALRPRRSD
jgi:hypothetical protein